MVNDLSGVAGYAQATSYFSANPSGLVGNKDAAASEQVEQKDPDINFKAPKGPFLQLSEIKDGATTAAKTINEASKALDKADALLNKLEEQVGLVKNYPPYPAGNEERAAYIKGIEGLRKQIDALTVPKVAESFPPVFYPKKTDFPELDAKVPSDAAVLAFGEAVQAVKQKVNDGRAELQAQAEQLSAQVGINLPPTQARTISINVADQLGTTSQPLAGNSGALVQLVG